MFVDGAGPSQTAAYKGFKALVIVLETVGGALTVLKTAATGLSGVMTVIDVCTAASRWASVRE